MHNKKNNTSKSKNIIQGLRPFSSAVPHGLKKILRKGGYNFSNIVDSWSKMVGNDMSKICYPVKIRVGKDPGNSTLVLNVIHGNELTVEYSKQEIIEKINSFFGYKSIGDVKLKITQEEVNMAKKIKNNDENTSNSFENVNEIKNSNLKNSLRKLIKAFNDKKN